MTTTKNILIIFFILIINASYINAEPIKNKDLLDNAKLDKIFLLLEEAKSLENNGSTIKAKRTKQKAITILDDLFKKGTLIVAAEKDYFHRFKGYDDKLLSREFGLPYTTGREEPFFDDSEVDDNPRIRFKFVCGIDELRKFSGLDNKSVTSSKVTEKFESMEDFTGTIKIVKSKNDKKTYFITNRSGQDVIIITCKVITITSDS